MERVERDRRPSDALSGGDAAHLDVYRLGMPAYPPSSVDSFLNLPAIRPPATSEFAPHSAHSALDAEAQAGAGLGFAGAERSERLRGAEGLHGVQGLRGMEGAGADGFEGVEGDRLERSLDRSVEDSAGTATAREADVRGGVQADDAEADEGEHTQTVSGATDSAAVERRPAERQYRPDTRKTMSNTETKLVYSVYSTLKKSGYINLMKVYPVSYTGLV